MAAISEATGNKNWLKLAVVPLLVGVLGFVLWSNMAPSTGETAMPEPTLLSASPPPLAVSSTKVTAQKPRRVTWPKFSNEQILSTNPFQASSVIRAALKTSAEPTPAEIAASEAAKHAALDAQEEVERDPWAGLIEAFQGKSAGVYIESSKGPALKIGTRLFHVGDRIGDSYRITGIRPDGIVVEAAPALK